MYFSNYIQWPRLILLSDFSCKHFMATVNFTAMCYDKIWHGIFFYVARLFIGQNKMVCMFAHMHLYFSNYNHDLDWLFWVAMNTFSDFNDFQLSVSNIAAVQLSDIMYILHHIMMKCWQLLKKHKKVTYQKGQWRVIYHLMS